MKEQGHPWKSRPPCSALLRADAVRPQDRRGRAQADFDAVYQEVIAPAVSRRARADPGRRGADRRHHPQADVRAPDALRLCRRRHDGANPNVFYELGIRHAMRPRSTVILFAEGTTLPFDIALLRGVPYRTGTRRAARAEAARPTRSGPRSRARANPHDDSPLFQLLDCMPLFEVDHMKTDIFRDRFDYSRNTRSGWPPRASRAQAPSRRWSPSRPGQPRRCGGRGRRRSLSVAARRQSPCRHDRALRRMPPPLQRTRLSASNSALRSTAWDGSRRPKKCSRRCSGVRTVQRNRRAPRSHLQGPLEDRQGGQAAGCAGPAQACDRYLPGGL